VRRVFGPRTVVEAVFLVAVPVVVLVLGQSPAVIIASAAVAYLLVLVFEAVLWRNRPDGPAAAAAAAAPAVEVPEAVRVLPAQAEPEPEPAPAPEPEPAAAPIAEEPVAEEPERILRPVPTPEPEPEPVAVAPQPEPQTVVALPLSSEPRQWNLWDLEHATREHAGADAARDEERSFLLMYLRDFAGPDGQLPIDFDGLVRDSFGDLLGAR
jgi:outer membrane biosynthesis protein TonB